MFRNSALVVIVAFVALFASTAQADSVSFTLDESFGAVPPTGSPVLTFDDEGTAGSVEVTFDLTDLTGGEKVTSWYFSFDGDATGLSFSYVSGPPVATNGITTSAAFDLKADGDGNYNILFDWPPSAGSAFNAGDVAVYDITGVGIVAVDFDVLGTPGTGEGNAGPYYTAVHVQSTGPDNDGSDWRGALDGNGNGGGNGGGTIPEPGALALVLAGLAGVALRRRRRKAS